MSGHGWVIPNPSGVKARCGGPAICPECAVESALAKVNQGIMPDEREARLLVEAMASGRVQLGAAQDQVAGVRR